MSILADLMNAAKALQAHQQGVVTAGRNLANANNPAYAKQRVVLGDRGVVSTALGPQSLGVEAIGLQNFRDQVLDRQVLRETSVSSGLSAELAFYQRLETATGQLIDRTGDSAFIDGIGTGQGSSALLASLNDFFNGFSALAANPTSMAERHVLHARSTLLVEQFRLQDGRLSQLQSDIRTKISDDSALANQLLNRIAGLSSEIGRVEVGNPHQRALELRDQRQVLLEELSGFLDFRVEEIPDSFGQIRIIAAADTETPPEAVLLERTQTFPVSVSYPPHRFTGGRGEVDLSLRQGSLAGLVRAHEYTADIRAMYDQLAASLVHEVNAIYGGTPPQTGDPFFDPAGWTSSTIALHSSVTVDSLRTTNDPTLPSDNSLALGLAELGLQPLVSLGNRTFSEFLNRVITDVGQKISSSRGQLESQEQVLRLIKNQQDGVSGVSIDEEMTDLMKFQRAFEASSRVIRMLDEMLDRIVNGLIR